MLHVPVNDGLQRSPIFLRRVLYGLYRRRAGTVTQQALCFKPPPFDTLSVFPDYINMQPKILFIPVSSPKGIGEYMRSLAIAQALKPKMGEHSIAFVLSEQAPYIEDCPFTVYRCPSSPTKHSDLVKRYIDEFCPNIVIFDASGRVSQFRHAKKNGAHTIFIAQHTKKLIKGLGLRRLPSTDQIWFVQPKYALPSLGIWSKLKLSVFRQTNLKVIGPIFQQPNPEEVTQILSELNLQKEGFILINSGSGGHKVNGVLAAEIFSQAGRLFAETTEQKVVIIYGPNFPDAIPDKLPDTLPNCVYIRSLSQARFTALLSVAQGAILGGGSALFQAISFSTPTVTCAISKDQNERIDHYLSETKTEEGLVRKSELNSQILSNHLAQLLHSKPINTRSHIKSGLDVACHEIYSLFNEKR